MASPSVTVAIEPFEAGSVRVLPLAAPESGIQGTVQLSLRVRIENQESTPIELSSVELAAAAGSSPPTQLTAVGNVAIDPSMTGTWNFNAVLAHPTPTTLDMRLSFEGFDDSVDNVYPVAVYESPVADGAYLFPTVASSMLPGEYWFGWGGHHGAGAQAYGYDMGVLLFNVAYPMGIPWDPGGSYSVNDDHLIWHKPVHAMADGEVIRFENDIPTNPNPLTWSSEDDLAAQMEEQKTKYWGAFQYGGAGNHFYIQHGTDVMLYAHFDQGELNPDFMTVGAKVKAGDFLGLIGNTGNSTAPHLHIHAQKGTHPGIGPRRPIPFKQICVLDRNVVAQNVSPDSNWVNVDGKGLPSVMSAIHPGVCRRPERDWVAVDPLALALKGSIYVKLTLPDPPPYERFVHDLRETLSSASPEELAAIRSRLQQYEPYIAAIEEMLRGH